jgi:cation-transporting P-type ATPase 13A2
MTANGRPDFLVQCYNTNKVTVPFAVTIVVTLLMSLYMLLDPARWLSDFMDLTEMTLDFELILLVMAAIGFVVAYVAERRVFPVLAKYIGRLKRRLRPSQQKKRKRYKEILEEMKD